MGGVINPAWKSEVVDGAASTLKPSEDGGASGLQKLELNRSSSLLLDHDCPRPYVFAAYKLTDLDFHKVASAKLTVDREIEQGSVANALFAIKQEADCPDLLGLQRPLGANQSSCVPCSAITYAGIVLRSSHDLHSAANIGREKNAWARGALASSGRAAFEREG
jgi:hypothetical protein